MQPNNTTDRLWEQFASTGKVNDYLRYRHGAAIHKEEGHGSNHEHVGADHTREQQYR